METKFIVMSADELKKFIETEVENRLQGRNGAETPDPKKRYVFGLRGIRDLFNVSLVTAQRYKDTFLTPAIMQRGRKIMVDVDKALELYNQRMNA